MSKKIILLVVLFFSLFLAACGGKATATPEAIVVAPTSTPDLCSGENLSAEIGKVNKLMREFDDYSSLASNTPQAQLIQIIPELQRVLRDAEDQPVPVCLNDLKKLQLAHMSVVVQTLMGFMNTTDATGAEQINAGIAQARNLHGQYDVEIARLLGITLVAPPTLTPAAAAPETNGTQILATPLSGLYVVNPGPDGVTLLATPDLNAGGVATLDAGLTAVAFGKTADGLWIQVEVPGQPGQKAWVSASLVQVSGQLPVATP